ncbi:hypothetical protein Tco_0395418, partial [Tanacetum coccineum]
MPYSVWKSLSLSELTPTCMTLELEDRLTTEPIGIAEDVFLMVGKFQFPADFVVARLPFVLAKKPSHSTWTKLHVSPVATSFVSAVKGNSSPFVSKPAL